MVRKMLFQTVCIFLFQIGHTMPKLTFLLDWWPNPNHVPLFVAQEKKLFEKQGIIVEILKINDAPDVIAHISTKQADIGLYYMPQSFVAAEKTPIRMFAPYIDVPLQGFLMHEECLEPKTVGGFPCALFSHFVEQLEHTPRMIFLHGDLAFNLHARTVDAVFGVYKNIEVHQLASQGIKTRFIGPDELGIPTFSELVFIAHKDFKKQRAFLKAIRESIEFCVSHPKQAFQLYMQANPDKTQKVLEWERKAWSETIPLFSRSLLFDMKKGEQFFTWLKEKKIISSKMQCTDCFIVDSFDVSKQDPQGQEQLELPQSEQHVL